MEKRSNNSHKVGSITTYNAGDIAALVQQAILKMATQGVTIVGGSSGGTSSGVSSGASNTIVVGSNDTGSGYTFDASAKTITFTGIGRTLKLEEIASITNVTSGVVIYNPADAALTGSITGDILTLTYDTTSMNDVDSLKIEIIDTTGIDYNLDAIKNIDQNPQWSHYSDESPVDTNVDITASIADIGSAVPIESYRTGGFWIQYTANSSADATIYLKPKKTSDGDAFTMVNESLYTFTMTDGDKIYVAFETLNTVPYIQVQAVTTSVGATAGTLTVDVTKGY